MPANYNIQVWKGNTLNVPMGLETRAVGGIKTPVDLTGSEIVFKATWPNGTLRKTSADSGSGVSIATDPTTGKFTIALTVAETRSLPVGKVKYEIERRIGSNQTTILFGILLVEEWVNDD